MKRLPVEDLMSGSRIRIWKQNSSLEQLGVRTSFIHTKADAGPREAEIVTDSDGIDIVEPDIDGDNLLSPDDAGSDLDAVHTCAVIRHVVSCTSVRFHASRDLPSSPGHEGQESRSRCIRDPE